MYKQTFAEALAVLLDDLEADIIIRRKDREDVYFSHVSVDTNENIPHLMTDRNNKTVFYTPTPEDIIATDWQAMRDY